MLQLRDIRKSYTTADFTQVALDDVSIAFRDNEFVAILGPSGSGKTTLLNIVGGLDHYDTGDLVIDDISTKKYRDRDWDAYRNNRIGFVFQSYNLIPHQTVLANVELALTLSGVSKAERRGRAVRALEEVGLGEHISKRPSQLSGGQMQRVAIARALINDPEILLADEPTGALDSKTSVQIMALLTEIARDRLVVMVTHNPNLAQEYATRTVNLSDGRVKDDSDPFIPTVDAAHISGKPTRKTVMSFFTAVALSFNNLMTKKGRTLMTAFAGSIGIIGIAAILALANGVNNYIKGVEEDTLSIYPLSIQSTGIDLMAMMVGPAGDSSGDSDSDSDAAGTGDAAATVGSNAAATAGERTVGETKMLSNIFSRIGSNDLASLKAFLDSGESGIEPYIKSIEYSYSVTPQIFNASTANGVRQVNPDTSFSALGMGATGSSNNLMSLGMSTDSFYEMPKDLNLVEAQYNILAGTWPQGYDECILILNRSGKVSDFLYYTMGLRDATELDEMVKHLANNEDIQTPTNTLAFTYDEIMGVTFKLVNAADYYKHDDTYNVWTDLRTDEAYLKDLVEKGVDLHIVGIAQPSPDAAATSLSAGLYYPVALTDHVVEVATGSRIVKDQLANPGINVFSGKSFVAEASEAAGPNMDLSTLITVDTDAISSAFDFDTSALNVDMSSFMNLQGAMTNLPAMPEPDLAAIASSIELDVPTAQLAALMSGVLGDYLAAVTQQAQQDPTLLAPDAIAAGLSAYLNTPKVQAQLGAALGSMVDAGAIQAQVQGALQTYMQATMQAYMGAVMANVQGQITSAMQQAMGQLTANMAGAMGIDEAAFANAFQFNMDEEELTQLMMSFMGGEETSCDNNLKKLGYADPAKPSGIDIYPIDFESKGKVIDILDAYNERMKAAGDDDRVIVYTDLVGTLMSSVTDIVNMVSYVLVAFVAISLVVSSIMIGVITYISVLERKKEIGILRSIGASKKDISHVFNAETLIVGFVAGVIGIVLTLLLTIPANAIVLTEFGVENVAILPWEAAIILVAISMALTFLAGLIPSSAASRKDPVEALRSE